MIQGRPVLQIEPLTSNHLKHQSELVVKDGFATFDSGLLHSIHKSIG